MSTSTPTRPPADIRPTPRWNRPRVVIALAVAVVLALIASLVVLLRGDDATTSAPPTASPIPTPSASPAPTGTATPSPTESGDGGTVAPASEFRFVALWPFGSAADAARWQQGRPTSGTDWQRDPARTALRFARDYLGYTELDRATSVTRGVGSRADQVWVGVGYGIPEGTTTQTAAVLHLARIGSGPLDQRPWEVVGSRDTGLSLTIPKYGATVGSPLRVGGRISGVDESLVVQVRSLGGGLLARVGSIPAGGMNEPWSAIVTVRGATSGIATVAVSTGGHLQGVERFAITAIRLTRPRTFSTADQAIASLVDNGTYVGSCSAPSSTSVDEPVCSVLVRRSGERYVYGVGYLNTDVGYFVLLARQDGRWVIVEPYLEQVPNLG